MRRRQILFATYRAERLDEEFSYAVELARTLEKDLRVLLVVEKKADETLGDLMSAVAFAEVGEHETAKEIMRGGIQEAEKNVEELVAPLVNRCRMAGVGLEVRTSEKKITAAIDEFIKKYPGVDMVLLGPTVSGAGRFSEKELKRLVASVSRPVVTMARQSSAA